MSPRLGPLLLALSVAACDGRSISPSPSGGEEVRSHKQRITSPQVSPADRAAVAAGNTDFAFSLFRSVRDRGDNVLLSPLSISTALAMTSAGARGRTLDQMSQALHFTLPQERLHPAINDLDLALASRGRSAKAKDGTPFRLNITNSIWGQKGFTFLAPFLDTLAQHYGAGLRILDFVADPDGSRRTINDWVADRTEQRILDLLPPQSVTPLTRLVLTNTIYFNASWQKRFDPKETRPGTFTARDGKPQAAQMMNLFDSFRYAEWNGMQALELPYDGEELSLWILLPAPGRLDAVEQSLGRGDLDQIRALLATTDVRLSMPRFSFDFGLSLRQTLEGLGMRDAFGRDADLSGMNGQRDLYISDVIHKTFIAVDEKGTEAAAATAVLVAGRGAPVEPKVVKLDRPFLVLIRDQATGAVIFLGRVGRL